MQWEKKICIRLTTRRIIGAILTASTVVNMVIVGAAFEASAPNSTSTVASVLTLPPSTTAFFNPPSTAAAAIPITGIETPGTIPTEVFTPTDTPISSSGWIVCIKKFYWSDYLVQPGDTLYSLANATGSSVEELMLANCLPDNRIYYGQILYVPHSPVKIITATSSATATDPGTATLTMTATATSTGTPTNLPTATSTSTPTYTPTATLTHTATNTATATSTDTLTPTLIYTGTPTPTNTPDISLTIGANLTSSVVPAAN
jgi:LysM repeat protein